MVKIVDYTYIISFINKGKGTIYGPYRKMEECFVIRFLSFTLAFKLVSSLHCNEGHYIDTNGKCLKCPDHCQFCSSTDSCLTCINGYWGNLCENFCHTCKEETSCAKSTGFCNKDCKDGYTGGFCDAKCNGKCSSCNRTNAQICLHCAHGWYPPVSCNKSCPDSCNNSSCTAQDFCTNGCNNGFYGQLCELRCSKNCKDNLCYQANGTCAHGCEGRFTGTKCDTTEKTGNTAIVVAVVLLVLTLVFGAVIASVIVVWRRRRSTPAQRKTLKRNKKEGHSSDTEDPETIEIEDSETSSCIKKSDGDGAVDKTGTSSETRSWKTRADRNSNGTKPLKTRAAKIVHTVIDRVTSRVSKVAEKTGDTDGTADKPQEEAVIAVKKKTREENLREVIDKINAKTVEMYESEFNRLPNDTRTSSEKKKKNTKEEEEEILHYDKNKVVVPGKHGELCASFIKRKDDEKEAYIASKGPRKEDDHYCLWTLLWENDYKTVVMLNTFGKEEKKKEQYWPNLNKKKQYGSISVRCAEEVVKEPFITRTFTETKKECTPKHVSQLQYKDWPERGVPDMRSLLDFLNEVKKTQNEHGGPLVVHGRRGVGRTGTFIALDMLIKEVKDMADSDEEKEINIYACVESLRNQRISMVETIEQYKFLHVALSSSISEMLEGNRGQQNEDVKERLEGNRGQQSEDVKERLEDNREQKSEDVKERLEDNRGQKSEDVKKKKLK